MAIKNEAIKIDVDSLKRNQKYGYGYRHVQVLLVCVFISISFILRVDISVAIVAMTDESHNNTNIEIFNWNKKTKDIILSSFFWGYTAMQIPMGYLVEKLGAKPLFTLSMLTNGIVTLLTPLAVHWGGWIATCVCRALQGITQSCVFSGTMALASRWIPNGERSRLVNFMYSGTTLGTVAGMPLSSLIASSALGWPYIFYIIGAMSLAFAIVWIIFGASDPASHTAIREEEKEFINRNITFSYTEKKKKVPWKKIISSTPVYSILLAQIGYVWVNNIVTTEMPSYFNKILGINLKNSGIYSALPFIGMWIWSVTVSVVSDMVINKDICTKLNARRIFNSLGSWFPGVLLVIMTYIPQGHPFIVIGFFVFTASFMSSINMGYMLSFIDVAPNYSGTILGMTNCVSQAIGAFAPLLVGYMVVDENDPKQWQEVFFITSAILIVCNTFYIMFISTDIQPWNNHDIDVKTERFENQKLSLLEDANGNNK